MIIFSVGVMKPNPYEVANVDNGCQISLILYGWATRSMLCFHLYGWMDGWMTIKWL